MKVEAVRHQKEIEQTPPQSFNLPTPASMLQLMMNILLDDSDAVQSMRRNHLDTSRCGFTIGALAVKCALACSRLHTLASAAVGAARGLLNKHHNERRLPGGEFSAAARQA